MQYIAYFVTAASIIGTVANSLKKRWCFWVWICTNAFWVGYNLRTGSYAQALLYVFNFVMAVVGLVQWRRKDMQKGGGNTMKAVERFTKSQAKRLKQEIRSQVAKENERYERSFDVFLMYILHRSFGFGQKRLEKVYRDMVRYRDELKRQYMADGDTQSDDYIFAMERDLKESGVDVDSILCPLGYKKEEER